MSGEKDDLSAQFFYGREEQRDAALSWQQKADVLAKTLQAVRSRNPQPGSSGELDVVFRSPAKPLGKVVVEAAATTQAYVDFTSSSEAVSLEPRHSDEVNALDFSKQEVHHIPQAAHAPVVCDVFEG